MSVVKQEYIVWDLFEKDDAIYKQKYLNPKMKDENNIYKPIKKNYKCIKYVG